MTKTGRAGANVPRVATRNLPRWLAQRQYEDRTFPVLSAIITLYRRVVSKLVPTTRLIADRIATRIRNVPGRARPAEYPYNLLVKRVHLTQQLTTFDYYVITGEP